MNRQLCVNREGFEYKQVPSKLSLDHSKQCAVYFLEKEFSDMMTSMRHDVDRHEDELKLGLETTLDKKQIKELINTIHKRRQQFETMRSRILNAASLSEVKSVRW